MKLPTYIKPAEAVTVLILMVGLTEMVYADFVFVEDELRRKRAGFLQRDPERI